MCWGIGFTTTFDTLFSQTHPSLESKLQREAMDKITLPGPFGVLRLTMDSDDQWLTDTDSDDSSSESSDSGSDSSDAATAASQMPGAVTVVFPIVLPVVLPMFRSKKRL